MSDWWELCWWAGGVLVAMALLAMIVALFRDRSRGRRRCPKCWYDMSGGNGMMCPECGRTQKKEKRFFRTRRRWRGVATGLVLLGMGAAVAVAPAASSGKWAKYTPLPVLDVILGFFPGDVEAAYAKTIRSGGTRNLGAWERMLVAHGIGERLESGESDALGTIQGGPGRKGGRRKDEVSWDVMILTSLGDEARPALTALRRLLASDDVDVRRVVSGAHGSLGETASANARGIGRMIGTLEDSEKRIACLRTIVFMGKHGRGAMNAVVRAMRQDPESTVRLEACWALAMIGENEAASVEAIAAVAHDRTVADRRRALAPIAWFAESLNVQRREGEPRPLFDMGRQTRSADLKGPVAKQALEEIVGFLRDEDRAVRVEAAWHLQGVHGDRVTPYASRVRELLLSEADDEVRRRLVDAYIKTDTVEVVIVVRSIVSAFESSELSEWDWGVQKFAWCGSAANVLVPDLQQLTTTKSGACRAYVCDALALTGEEGMEVLAALLEREGELGGQAAKALAWTNKDADRAAELLLGVSHSGSPVGRANGALGLSRRVSAPGAERRLIEMSLTDPDAGVRLQVIGLLAALDEYVCFHAWAGAMRDADAGVREEAARRLGERARWKGAALKLLEALEPDLDPVVSELARKQLEMVRSAR